MAQRNQNGTPVGGGTRKHSGKSEADRIAEENEVLDLKLLGATDRRIAAQLGVTHTTVQNRLKAALERIQAPKVEELRTLMTEQLDTMMVRLGTGVANGDTKSIMAALQVLDRKAKLYGLDAPAQHQITIESEADKEIKDLMNMIAGDSTKAREDLVSEA